MPNGVDRRAIIDTETFKGLLIINGGGAVAMLGFLSTIIDRPGFQQLSRAILWSVILLALGLAAAVAHNHFRRRCSSLYERYRKDNREPPKGKLLGVALWAPTVCSVEQVLMWLSLGAFIAACAYVAVVGITVLPGSPPVTPTAVSTQ